ncbi:MAG: histidine kinase N-terminal 7TM domain-containing protein [Haloarculaceae archaeon]
MDYLVITLVGTLLSLGLAGVAWRARHKPGALPLVGVKLSVAAWNFGWLVAILANTPALEIAGARLHFVGVTLIGPSFVVLLLEFAGREELLTRRIVAALLVEPVAVNALVWTNDAHGLFLDYAPLSQAGATRAGVIIPGAGVVPVDVGPLFWLHAIYVWLLVVGCLAYLVALAVRRRDLYRRQLALLSVGVSVPLAASLLDNLGLSPIRLTEPSFVVLGVFTTLAIMRFDLIDVTPIARDTVLEEIDGAIFVLDGDDNVTDLNPAARSLLGVADEPVVGRSATDVLAAFADVYEHFADVAEGRETVVVDTAAGARRFDVRVSGLTDARGRSVGRVFLAHDVTEERERRDRLERQNERLTEFASVVSHDLRNPLQVATTHVDLAREVEDDERHLRSIADSHDRMEAIIRDVLALARQGDAVTDPERVSLSSVADDAWETVDTGDATFRNELVGWVEADRSRLRRAFENLFRNCIDHGAAGADPSERPTADDAAADELDDGGGLVVRAGTIAPSEGNVIDLSERGFFVEDDGPGIPPTQRSLVFEHGYSDVEDGTGLGLSIVQSIVEAHGWSIAAEDSTLGGASDARGESAGARFTVTGVDVRDPAASPGDWTGDGEA